MKLVKPKRAAKFASVLAEEGYTANIPLDDLLRPTFYSRSSTTAHH